MKDAVVQGRAALIKLAKDGVRRDQTTVIQDRHPVQDQDHQSIGIRKNHLLRQKPQGLLLNGMHVQRHEVDQLHVRLHGPIRLTDGIFLIIVLTR
jgi:hypothetical protein